MKSLYRGVLELTVKQMVEIQLKRANIDNENVDEMQFFLYAAYKSDKNLLK